MHVRVMRYAQGGGLDARARARREQVRRDGVRMLDAGMSASQVARALRVTPQAVRGWRRRCAAGGEQALASAGAGGARCKLDDAQLAVLGEVLDAGPAEAGWVHDQRWTLARVAAVIQQRFGVSYSLKGVSVLLHRIGFSPQVPAHRAIEADGARIGSWVREAWPHIKALPPG